MAASQLRVIVFAVAGLISGALSTAGIMPFAPPGDFGLLIMFVLPGLAFGATIGPLLTYGGWLPPSRVPAWIIFAALGHFAAALCVTGLTWRLRAALPLSEISAIAMAAALAGALGGGILAGANRFLVASAGWVGPTIVGAAFGPLVLVHDAGPILGRLIFYIIWQSAYAAALAIALPQPLRVQNAN